MVVAFPAEPKFGTYIYESLIAMPAIVSPFTFDQNKTDPEDGGTVLFTISICEIFAFLLLTTYK